MWQMYVYVYTYRQQQMIDRRMDGQIECMWTHESAIMYDIHLAIYVREIIHHVNK